MATKKSQRIGIWVIAVVLGVGTLLSFAAMAIGVDNQSADSSKLNEAYSQYQADIEAQSTELSAKYFDSFNQYSTLPTAFDASSVTELKIEDLKVGDGAEVTADTEYSAYYIGWNPEGKVFGQSIEDDKTSLKAPLESGSMIEGWNSGVVGMKIGGVRLLTIPSDLAYGETGSGDDIPANTPLKFVVMLIPKVEDVEMPQILMDYYMSQSAQQ